MSSDPLIWIAALLTLAAFSYLFKENSIYKAVEHLYVGVAAGYAIVMGYSNVVTKAITPLVTNGQLLMLVPVVAGLLLFAPYMGARFRPLRRIPIAFITGIGAGITVRTAVEQQLVRQIQASVIPLANVNNVLIILGTVTTVTYFFFTFKPSPGLRVCSEAGKWVIMVTFGAAFGNAIMGRISLLIGRVQFIFGEWIHLIK